MAAAINLLEKKSISSENIKQDMLNLKKKVSIEKRRSKYLSNNFAATTKYE